MIDTKPCRDCTKEVSSGTLTCPSCGAPDPTNQTPEADEKGNLAKFRSEMKGWLEDAKRHYDEIGGWKTFKTGEWLWPLIQKTFKVYWERANADYFREKYPSLEVDQIAKILIGVAAKQASLLGGIVGSVVSTDEIVAFATGGEALIGIPGNIAIAAAALAGESMVLVRIQLQLVANLGKLYGVPLDPDDPEDVLTILAFALGGSAAQAAGNAGMKVGRAAAGRAAKIIFSKDTLALVKKVAAKIGIKILQRSIVKYTVPIASIGIGVGWNYFATRAVGRLAIRHFKSRVRAQS